MIRDPVMRIDDLVARRAAAHPTDPAIEEGARVVSYQALDAAIDACAALLERHGARAGERVAIVGDNSFALVALLLAASRCDATAVILNPRLTPHELDTFRAHAAPRCTVFYIGGGPEAGAHASRLAAHRVDIDGVGVLEIAGATGDNAPATDGVAAIVYTSGTSGRPKGVMLTHANLAFIAETSVTLRDLRPADRVYGALPIYHVYGLASMLLGTLCAGARLLVHARFDAKRALDAVAAGLTVFQAVPAMYARILESLPGNAIVFAPRLRYLYAGGSPLDATLKAAVEHRFAMPLHNGYGLTECSPTVSATRLGMPRADTSVGPPIDGIEVHIVAPRGDDGRDRDVGELWVRGPNVMRGYYRDADATAATITTAGWLRTGDLARRGPDGALFIVGRLKDLIIRSGMNVYPGEVESVLNAHPAVAQSVVVGRTLANGNEEVVAFVELKAGRGASVQELLAHAAASLAPYKRPNDLRILDALPASATGKVLRAQLKQAAQ